MENTYQNLNSNGVLFQDIISVIEDTENYLQFLNETGCKGFDCSKESIEKINSWRVRNQKSGVGSQKSEVRSRKPEVRSRNPEVRSQKPTANSQQPAAGNQQPETIEIIQKDINDCQRCKIANDRKNILFGTGNPKTRLVFVGDIPSYEEDEIGEFFKGDVGELFVKIVRAIDFTPEQIYICNIVKCRPPAGRDPVPDEIKICLPFLKRQLAVIKPDFICVMGNLAAQTLLETTTPISELRGHFYNYMGAKLLPTFHPKYLLRYPDKKREAWDDMKMLMKEMRK